MSRPPISPMAQERDEDVENSYEFHRDFARQSVPEYVSANRDELALDFYDWQLKQGFQGDQNEMLLRFEEERFGRALEPVAHGMLSFAISYRKQHLRQPSDAVFSSDVERANVEEAVIKTPVVEKEGYEARLLRIAQTAGLMDMPTKPTTPTTPRPVEVRLPYRDGPDEADWLEDA